VWFTFAITFISCHDDEKAPEPEIEDCLVSGATRTGTPIPGEYIVAFPKDDHKNGRGEFIAARVLARHKIEADRIVENIDGEYSSYVMRLSVAAAEALKNDSDVILVEPDRIISVCACFTVEEPRLVTWNVDKVGYGDGTGKTAWVMDTGIDFNHPDLIVDQTRSRVFVEGVTSAADDNGHGTHVAGIIGAKNNNIGTLGVASGATLVSLKILDDEGNGRLSTALKALTYVKSNAKAGDVVNISISLQEISEILEHEIIGVANRKIYVTIAAGNENRLASDFSPGRTSGDNVYTISAVDSLNQFAGFSNYGNDAIDFAAPGVRILSSYFNSRYAIMSGTSMAAPHVAGLLLINNGKVNTQGYALNDPDGTPDPLAHQ
jgi:subtilisin family serine protease